MVDKCIVDSTHGKPVYLFKKCDIDIYKCGRCGSVMADVSEDDVTEAFGSLYETGDYYTMSSHICSDLDSTWGDRWRYILRRLERAEPQRRLLDVGAGNGYFVYIANHEFGIESVGIEPSTKQAEFARESLGVTVDAEMLADHAGTDYTAITVLNVIEHVTDPSGLLREVSDRLAPNGHIVVSTPNPGCLAARVKGLERWCIVYPPHHVNVFGRVGLVGLLTAAGFEVVHYETLSSYVHFLGHSAAGETLRSMIKLTLRMLRLGGDHLVIARKR